MSEISSLIMELQKQLCVARNELKNIRQQMICMKKDYERNVKLINDLLVSHQHKQLSTPQVHLPTISQYCQDTSLWSFKPIGYIESVFSEKNGTPRQAAMCQHARATLTISREVFTNPHHSVIGLELFSHIWILFVFHKNKGEYSGAKVRPPRLNGAKMGLFATRSPHRPNNVGLTLARLEKIEGNVIHLLGVDMVSGTPVIDIKPYIPQYDSLQNHETRLSDSEDISTKQREQQLDDSATCLTDMLAVCSLPSVEVNSCGSSDDSEAQSLSSAITLNKISDTFHNIVGSEVSIADWITKSLQRTLQVLFTARADQQLKLFDGLSVDPNFQLRHLRNAAELRSALTAALQVDPRSVYRRKHCHNQLYYMTVDIAHVTCWFDDDTVEVLKVESAVLANRE